MVKCSEVLQCSPGLLVLSFFIVLYMVLCFVRFTLTEVFPCFFLSCKANTRVFLAKTGHGPHSSHLVNCVVLCIVLYCVVLCVVFIDCFVLCIVCL